MYILGRDGGVPLMYSDNNVSGDKRWGDLYKRVDIQSMIPFHNGTQGRSMQIVDNNDCILMFKREHVGVAGTNKCKDR